MPKNKRGNEAAGPKFVIKKKITDGDGGHHGGVWKIAYADFMTAMMTFFLVMWLINSSSKEKISQLANYFNPVKLADKTPPSKAVREDAAAAASGDETETKPEKNEKKEKSAKEEQKSETKADKSEQKLEKAEKAEKKNEKSVKKSDGSQHPAEDETLFLNPFGVLTQLASEAEGEMASAMARGNTAALGAGGVSLDPFVTDPIASQSSAKGPAGGQESRDANASTAASKGGLDSGDNQAAGKAATDGKSATDGKDAQPSREAMDAAARLAKDVNKVLDSLPKSFRPNITTKATPEGVLVSLMDDTNFSMFKIASAEPSPQLVVVLDKIGNLLNKQPGKIVVRGHTDGRQYSGDAHGNWRLSVNRANMTYYMLLRAKVEDARFLAVEGYADRNLKNRSNPLAAENRRIDILIKAVES